MRDKISRLYEEKQKLSKSRNSEYTRELQNKQIYQKPNEPIKEKISNSNEITPEEKHILKMSLNNPEAYIEMSKKFRINESIFISDFAKECYLFIKTSRESNNNPINLLFSENNNISDEIKTFLIDISIDKEQASKSWEKYGAETLEMDIYRNLKDSILKLEIRKIDDELDMIKRQTKNADQDLVFKLLTKQTELSLRRQQLSNLLMGLDLDI